MYFQIHLLFWRSVGTLSQSRFCGGSMDFDFIFSFPILQLLINSFIDNYNIVLSWVSIDLNRAPYLILILPMLLRRLVHGLRKRGVAFRFPMDLNYHFNFPIYIKHCCGFHGDALPRWNFLIGFFAALYGTLSCTPCRGLNFLLAK